MEDKTQESSDKQLQDRYLEVLDLIEKFYMSLETILEETKKLNTECDYLEKELIKRGFDFKEISESKENAKV